MGQPGAAVSNFPTLCEQRRAELSLAQAPLEQARSLPAWAYTDAAYHGLEEQLVLRREWLSVGRVEDVPEPGDYFSTSILNEPLIVVRGDDGEIRTPSGVCRHRAMVLASASGNTKRFSCPYHAWTYDLQGDLLAAPMMDGNEGFDKHDCSLPKVRTEIWQGWIFINFDPEAEALGPRLEKLDEILAPYRLSKLKTATEPLVYDQHFNWKLLTDNWENYHVLGAHKETFLAAGLYTPESVFPWEDNDAYSVWLNPLKSGVELPIKLAGGEAVIPGLPEQLHRGYVGVHVFPCHLVLLSPEDMIYYKILPQRVDFFRLEASVSFLPEIAEDEEMKALIAERLKGLDYIHGVEDVAVLEGGNLGWRSRMVQQGYLSPEEKALWQFYNYLVPRVLGGLGG